MAVMMAPSCDDGTIADFGPRLCHGPCYDVLCSHSPINGVRVGTFMRVQLTAVISSAVAVRVNCLGG